MRKVLIAGLLGGLGATAFAQSNVTMYGLADAYVGYGKSSDTFKQTRVGEGGYAASQLGFRGTEDLGGGLKANFNVEMGISLDTGNGNIPGPNLAFTRQSWVGLSGNWGAVTFGRQYTPLFRLTWRPDPFGVNTVFSPVTLWAQTDAQAGLLAWAARSDNALMYSSPSNLPIVGTLMYAPGESSGPSARSGDYMGGSLTWSSGPVWLGYAFQQRRGGTAAAPVAVPSKSTAHAVAVNYQVDAFRVGASYGQQDVDITGIQKATLLSLHGQVNFGRHQVLATATLRNVADSPRDQQQLALGYNYDLSKRTSLYGRITTLRNKGNASASLAGAGVTVAPNSGNSASLIGVGMIHRF